MIAKTRSPAYIAFCSLLYLGLISYIGYCPDQTDFVHIYIPYLLAFSLFLFLYRSVDKSNFTLLLTVAILSRFILVFSFPNLSDDIYRFIWDGRMTHIGLNPYSYLPSEVVDSHILLPKELFEHLNSPTYYTIYPPLAQITFYMATFFPSVGYFWESIFLKLLLLAFEIGTLRLLYLLLKKYELDVNSILLYALNPLIVLELLGNLHYEGVMIFFLLAALFYFGKHLLDGCMFSLSIATKLLPIIFLPAFVLLIRKKGFWKFTGALLLILLLLFWPILMGFFGHSLHFADSLDLYMRKFEFNAGLYYVLRALGYFVYGYNTIHILGPMLALTALGGILFMTFKARVIDMSKIFPLFLMIFTYFLLLSMTIHPWYLSIPIVFSCFTRFRFPIIWSGMIFLTYINYSYGEYHENLWVVFFEYLLVYAVCIYEIRRFGWLDSKNKGLKSII